MLVSLLYRNMKENVTSKTCFIQGYKPMIDFTPIVKWIISVLGSGTSTQKYLDQMFAALESYFHRANYGRHSKKLNDFLARLTNFFVKRLHR